MHYIGIDCGTQGTKAIIFDSESGKVLAKGYAKHPIIACDDGTREQKAEWWISALETAVMIALNTSGIDRTSVKAISVSGQQHGLVLLDDFGTVLRNVKLWNDTSTAQENESIIEHIGGNEKVWDLLGTALPVGFTASKIRYIAQYEPNIYQKTTHILLPHDYINYYLTNTFATDSSEASGTGYYSIQNRAYCDTMIFAIDASGLLKKALPTVYPWEKPIGTLLPHIAKRWGLSKNVIVAAGGGDNTMGAIGTSAIIDGHCAINLGTSGTVCMATPPFNVNMDKLIQVYDVLQKRLVTICTLNATSATTTIQDLFGFSLEELDNAIEASPPGSSGVIVIPFFNGERMPPLPKSHGVIKNITSLNCKTVNIVRATAEAVSFTLRWGFDKLLAVFPKPEKLIITGGGGNSAPWRQIIADVFNMPVYQLQSNEGGAFGAALQAMYAERIYAGETLSMHELCQRYVILDKNKLTTPITKNVHLYEGFYVDYMAAIKKEWNIEV